MKKNSPQYNETFVILYDAEEGLFYCKVGLISKDSPLHYTVWGQTEREVMTRADSLVSLLSIKQPA